MRGNVLRSGPRVARLGWFCGQAAHSPIHPIGQYSDWPTVPARSARGSSTSRPTSTSESGPSAPSSHICSIRRACADCHPPALDRLEAQGGYPDQAATRRSNNPAKPWVGSSSLESCRWRRLSGGQKHAAGAPWRKVLLAPAPNLAILLLDQPTNHLDLPMYSPDMAGKLDEPL